MERDADDNDATGGWNRDAYLEWISEEKVPVEEGLAVDLMSTVTEPWERIGAPAAVVHLQARGDFSNLVVVDVPAGESTVPIHHLYEALVFVLDGNGSTLVTRPDGWERSFEWRSGSAFALPLNATYRHFNASGTDRARLAMVTELPAIMKLYRDPEFIYGSDYVFPDRFGPETSFDGGGTFIPVREHRNIWDTNFVPQLHDFEHMTLSNVRGAGSLNIMFVLGNGSMHAHMSEIPAGNYKKAHRHEEGYHIFQLSDTGYSLYWNDGSEPSRVDWTYGLVHAPPRGMWHQHFNLAAAPARYLAMGFGSIRWPFLAEKRASWGRTGNSVDQIEYEDETPGIRKIFEEARSGSGAAHD